MVLKRNYPGCVKSVKPAILWHRTKLKWMGPVRPMIWFWIQVVARLLLKRGAEVNMQGMHKETPLHDAARNGHFQVCVITNDHVSRCRWKNPEDPQSKQSICHKWNSCCVLIRLSAAVQRLSQALTGLWISWAGAAPLDQTAAMLDLTVFTWDTKRWLLSAEKLDFSFFRLFACS